MSSTNTTSAHCITFIQEDDIDDIIVNSDEQNLSSEYSQIDIAHMGFSVDAEIRQINLSLEFTGIPDVAENREYIAHISASKWDDKENRIQTTTVLMEVIDFNVSYYMSSEFDANKNDPSTKPVDGDFALVCSQHVITLAIPNVPSEYDLTVFDEVETNSLHISAETNFYQGDQHYQDVLVFERDHQVTSNSESTPIETEILYFTLILIGYGFTKRRKNR
jgi:hypothetical protein